MQYLLDTSTCIFFLRGKLNLDDHIRSKGLENFYVSEITIAELRFGAENSADPKKSHKAVDSFLNGLSVIPVLGSVRHYASEKVRLRKMGRPINDEFDLLIGVTSVENRLTLVTDNVQDFERIDGIKIENWFTRV
jgi:tRNA(fMet)-specific endonuclease VapC